MQHLDRCLEHFHKLHQPLVGFAQAAAEAVGIRIILGIVLQHADIDLAHQGRDVLVVVVARFGLGYTDLVQHGGVTFNHPELADVAAKLMQAFDCPG